MCMYSKSKVYNKGREVRSTSTSTNTRINEDLLECEVRYARNKLVLPTQHKIQDGLSKLYVQVFRLLCK